MTGAGRGILPRDRRGVAAIEFAMVSGALIALCVGTIEVGLLFWGQNALEAAAAETARCVAIASPACPNPGTYAAGVVSKWMFSGVISASDVKSSTTTSCHGTSGQFQQVSITSTYFVNWLPPFVSALAHKTLSASACYPK